MFTGLVECTGRLALARKAGTSRRLKIEAPFASELEEGESVAVAGACLSVEANDEGHFEVTAVSETLTRTTLGKARIGTLLNLERSLRLSDRLGGHLVTGHIDAVGRVARHTTGPSGRILEVTFPVEFDPLIVDKGSIALDGVSLTVVVAGRGRFTVALIPQTCQLTTLGRLKTGDHVNLEFDLVAKYWWRQARVGQGHPRKESERV